MRIPTPVLNRTRVKVPLFFAMILAAGLLTLACGQASRLEAPAEAVVPSLGGASDDQAYRRPYGQNAPWNVPVADLSRHPESGLYVRRLWQRGSDRPGNFQLSFDGYTYPVYEVSDATGMHPIAVDWRTPLHDQLIPWNPAWRAATGTDSQVIILDPPTGREWNLWQVRFDGQTVHATNANLVPGSYWTREVGYAPSRGAGIPYLAMLIRPGAVEDGKIPHALSLPIRNTDGKLYVAPATKIEFPDHPSGVPEGMRFALDVEDADIEDWIETLPDRLSDATRSSARIIARALRDYGWFITDTAGAAHFQFEDRATAGAAWDRLGLAPAWIDGKEYPRDLLDGLLTRDRIYAVVPSDEYPLPLRAREGEEFRQGKGAPQ